MKNKPYKKFPGSRTFLAKDSLWLGQDHMLYVVLWFITEEYRRFYFKDIQAITMHRTSTWKRLNILFSILGGVSILVALVSPNSFHIFFFIVTGVVFAVFLIHLIQGPTCECHIQTAVQKVKLTPLKRVRKAKKVMEQLTILAKKEQSANA